LTNLAAERILLADKVAAAKFGTTQPIDDPVREQQVLDSVATMSHSIGIDPAVSVQFFRDQIEANKVVQRGLYSKWEAYPELRPTHRPDLSTEVRPQLDQITGEMLQQLRATQAVRNAMPGCHVFLSNAGLSTERGYHLDGLHRASLKVALRSVCKPAHS
jgi:chorismate mutase